ncbi:MAG: DUF4097 family beta strand repeat-containing protein [Candidatus Coproplasma sp.]
MKKICDYSVQADVKNIYCNIDNCRILVKPTEDKSLTAKFSEGAKVNVANNSFDLVISQKARFREKFFGSGSRIEIYVPEHLVVNLIISGKFGNLSIEGGIYGEVDICTDCGNFSISGVAADGVTVKTKAGNLKISDSTVKDKLLTNIECGNFTVENSFAAHINCRIRSGNAGAVNLNCRDSIFEVTAGNVNATVLGDEKTFDVIVNAKSGTCNKESINIEDELGVFKAYADCGNINVEFIQPEDFSHPEEEIG